MGQLQRLCFVSFVGRGIRGNFSGRYASLRGNFFRGRFIHRFPDFVNRERIQKQRIPIDCHGACIAFVSMFAGFF